MSKYFSRRLSGLTPYVPGEQPQDMQYVKLNTNESPFPPSEKAMENAAKYFRNLNLYPDPECTALRSMLAGMLGVDADEVIVTNGSDEVLDFAFRAFCDDETPALFPDITYGFYPVFAKANGIKYNEIPLREDFTINTDDYAGHAGTVFIANPNAPTGLELSQGDIIRLLEAHPDNVVVVDEAYVDFGAESAVPLIRKYDNLLVTQTFSKSRSMAGGRLGFAVGNKSLIQDLNTVRNSFNPYNINSMTMAVGMGILEDEQSVRSNCRAIAGTRRYTTDALRRIGFEVTESKANFVFARTDAIEGGALYSRLKSRGVLVRHFNKERISDYNRITIGTMEQMDVLLEAAEKIITEA